MIVKQKLGKINSAPINKNIDWVELEWHETNKRILHTKTTSGREVILKFLKENQNLTQGDILFEDNETIVAVNIQPCEVIIIKPKNMFEVASVCYEIGNKHLPLFYQDNELLVPYEAPLFRMLYSGGYDVEKENRKLINPLKSTVTPHGHNSESLFSKILKLTTSADE